MSLLQWRVSVQDARLKSKGIPPDPEHVRIAFAATKVIPATNKGRGPKRFTQLLQEQSEHVPTVNLGESFCCHS